MHHTKLKPFRAIWTLLLGLVLGGTCPAQVPTPAEKLITPPPILKLETDTSQRVQMRTKRKIKKVENPRPIVATVTVDKDDPTSVLINTHKVFGITRITITDEAGVVEELIVEVEDPDKLPSINLAALQHYLREAVPTASIRPILVGDDTVLLTGTVARAEDVDIALNVARHFVGAQIGLPAGAQQLPAGAQQLPAGVQPAGGQPSVVYNPPELTPRQRQALQRHVLSALRVGGVMQVKLDVVVARVSRQEIRQLEFAFLNNGRQHVLSHSLGALLALPTGGIAGTFPGGPTITNTTTPPNVFLGIFNPDQDFFGFLQALRTENLVKLMAEPKLVTMSGRPARFNSGGQQAVPQVAGLGGTAGVEFVDFGTTLSFLPIVLGTGKIHLQVESQITQLDNASGIQIPGGGFVAGRIQQFVNTTVELESGHTLAIGGLIQRTVQATAAKLPILGDLPFIGAAFSRKEHRDLEEELVVLVTPRLVDALSCEQLPKWLPGEETRNPDDFELFLEGILEAPRGPREVFPNQRYRAAYLNGPTASLFPCAGNGGHCGHGACGTAGCSVGGTCATPVPGTAPATVGSPQPGQLLPAAVMESQPQPTPEGTAGALPLIPPPQEEPAQQEGVSTPPASLGTGPTPASGNSGQEPRVVPPAAPETSGSGEQR